MPISLNVKYANDNLAAFIPQHVARRPSSRAGKSAKKKRKDFWQERQVPVKRKPAFYQAGRSYIPKDDAALSAELEAGLPEENAAETALKKDAARKSLVAVIEKSGIFSLKAFFIIVLTAFFAILAYNALLWQRNYADLKPAEDGLAGEELLDFAYQVQPPAGEASDEIPLPKTETYSWEEYRVQKGDTISGIAHSFGLSMDAIIVTNNISRARALREGETLKIPNMDGIPIVVKKGDTLAKLSSSYGVPITALLDANDLSSETLTEGAALFIPGAKMKSDELRAVIGDIFIYPLKGRLSSSYGWRIDPISGERRFHAAIDLAAAAGTPVRAAMEGVVDSVGFNSTFGNYIVLSHPGGWTTMYAHLSSVAVTKGQKVAQSREIGKAGSTGYSTGPHLHFAVYKNNRAVNPLDYLTF